MTSPEKPMMYKLQNLPFLIHWCKKWKKSWLKFNPVSVWLETVTYEFLHLEKDKENCQDVVYRQ